MIKTALFLLPIASVAFGAPPLPIAKPEDVGLSAERLRRVHEMVMRRIGENEITGAVTLIARRGKVVHYEAHGLMDREANKPMVKDAVFRLASSSKPVTAVAILMLMEEGKLKLTDPVSRYIPEFGNAKVMLEAARTQEPMIDRPPFAPARFTAPADREITILDLLTHTSGLGSQGAANAEYQEIIKGRQPNDTLKDFIPRLGPLPLDFQPGTHWHYSPLAAFDTLGRIVEITSGLGFDEFLRTRLFEPLGMTDTWFKVPETERARQPVIYRHTAKGLEKMEALRFASPVYFSGAAGLHSTVADYFRFAQMLANGGVLDGKRILSPWTVDLMMRNNVRNLFDGQIGRPPHGMGFGLGGEVVLNNAEARMRKPDGSYGWDGAYGTYWWVNRKEQMVVILFVQTPGRMLQYDFDNAVSQAVVE